MKIITCLFFCWSPLMRQPSWMSTWPWERQVATVRHPGRDHHFPRSLGNYTHVYRIYFPKKQYICCKSWSVFVCLVLGSHHKPQSAQLAQNRTLRHWTGRSPWPDPCFSAFSFPHSVPHKAEWQWYPHNLNGLLTPPPRPKLEQNSKNIFCIHNAKGPTQFEGSARKQIQHKRGRLYCILVLSQFWSTTFLEVQTHHCNFKSFHLHTKHMNHPSERT